MVRLGKQATIAAKVLQTRNAEEQQLWTCVYDMYLYVTEAWRKERAVVCIYQRSFSDEIEDCQREREGAETSPRTLNAIDAKVLRCNRG